MCQPQEAALRLHREHRHTVGHRHGQQQTVTRCDQGVSLPGTAGGRDVGVPAERHLGAVNLAAVRETGDPGRSPQPLPSVSRGEWATGRGLDSLAGAMSPELELRRPSGNALHEPREASGPFGQAEDRQTVVPGLHLLHFSGQGPGIAFQAHSTRSITAPNCRRRSSMRS